MHRRELLATLLPGGSPSRPFIVASSSVIEQHATRSMPCPHCGGEHRVLEHERPVPHLRRVDVRCRHCSAERSLWFTIVPPADELN